MKHENDIDEEEVARGCKRMPRVVKKPKEGEEKEGEKPVVEGKRRGRKPKNPPKSPDKAEKDG
jgi:hypothetical protein